mmetsp:Transcript_53140/g.172820  ORF Transcript_53140/g.172820 Transcript_53140/m.172820 type:complete len:243 (-) Transcript_53140:1272-2000(-)
MADGTLGLRHLRGNTWPPSGLSLLRDVLDLERRAPPGPRPARRRLPHRRCIRRRGAGGLRRCVDVARRRQRRQRGRQLRYAGQLLPELAQSRPGVCIRHGCPAPARERKSSLCTVPDDAEDDQQETHHAQRQRHAHAPAVDALCAGEPGRAPPEASERRAVVACIQDATGGEASYERLVLQQLRVRLHPGVPSGSDIVGAVGEISRGKDLTSLCLGVVMVHQLDCDSTLLVANHQYQEVVAR